jgi:hypothetical protein
MKKTKEFQELNIPLSQAVHAKDPGLVAKLPTAHGEHIDAPVDALNLPAGQALQEFIPSILANLPFQNIII